MSDKQEMQAQSGTDQNWAKMADLIRDRGWHYARDVLPKFRMLIAGLEDKKSLSVDDVRFVTTIYAAACAKLIMDFELNCLQDGSCR